MSENENGLTDQRRRELEELGEFMSGLSQLAHAMNNPLTSLMGRAQLLTIRKDLDPDVAKAARVIEASGQRIADHVKELAQTVRARREEILRRLEGEPRMVVTSTTDGE